MLRQKDPNPNQAGLHSKTRASEEQKLNSKPWPSCRELSHSQTSSAEEKISVPETPAAHRRASCVPKPTEAKEGGLSLCNSAVLLRWDVSWVWWHIRLTWNSRGRGRGRWISVSSKTARATQRNPVLKNKRMRLKRKKKDEYHVVQDGPQLAM